LPFRNFLSTHYHIQVEDEILFDGREGYSHDGSIYFITSFGNKEIIHMEQAALAYFLRENGYKHISLPIQNQNEDWFTSLNNNYYMVYRVDELQEEYPLTPGEALAYFHELGTVYQYQPREISSYGEWKTLWINKLTAYESKIEQEAMNNPSDYYRFVMDVFPYIVGISENAIQYVQETNQEQRFHETDQGTITFRRYRHQLEEPIIWTDQLSFDHPARDLAEAIRFMFLNQADDEEINGFLQDYQAVRPLSIFSWRLIYARLIFPVHLLDALDLGFRKNDHETYRELAELFDIQSVYERKLRDFFEICGADAKNWNIPMLHWL